jgi:hypothetical protein
VANIYDVTNRGAVDVKWRVLEFSLLPSSALKFYRGMPTFVPRNAKDSRAVCGVPRKIYERNCSVCDIPRSNLTKELAFRSILASGGWHSAVCLRAECQGLKMVTQFVAFHGNLFVAS